MVPKGVAVADGVLVMTRLYYELPSEISVITLVDLQKLHGFTQRGRIQRQVAKTTRDNGSTVYDVDGNLMMIDESVMRGNKESDATRFPGRVNEINFLKQYGSDNHLWFNRLFSGVDTSSSSKGAAFAQHWLTNYRCDIPQHNERLDLNVRRMDKAKQERYRQYYSTALDRRGERTESTSAPKSKSAPSIKLRLHLKVAQTPKPKLVEAPAVLMNSNEEKDGEESEKKIPLAQKLGKLILRSEVCARMNNFVPAALGEHNGENYNKESNEAVASAPKKTSAELAGERSLIIHKTPSPAPINNTTPALVETSAERSAKLEKQIAVLSRELKETKEKAAAEEAAAEEAAAEKAAVEKAAAEKAIREREAAEKAAANLAKANVELNRRAANKSLKHMGASIKHTISAYLAQRKAEAADKTLVRKLDEELAPYFWDALDVTASEPQKRKFKEEEADDKRPAKIAKK